MKKEEKEDLRKLSIERLTYKLQELKKDKQRMEINLRMNGHSVKRYGYHSFGKSTYKFIGGNLKKIKKTIAFVNMVLESKCISQN